MTLSMERKKSSTVSYTPGKDDYNNENDDEIHMSLAPYIQTYLASNGHGGGCCGIDLPVPFERAAPRSWWNPKFDSEILEEQYKISAFPQLRLRFRYALFYILLISLTWLIYFIYNNTIENDTSIWPNGILGGIFIFTLLILYLTYTKYYRRYIFVTSLSMAVILGILSLLLLSLTPSDTYGLTLVGHFSLFAEIQLLIYTVIPMPLYACVVLCTLYSIIFELQTYQLKQHQSSLIINNNNIDIDNSIYFLNIEKSLIIRILMHISIHIIGIHILIMTFVRMRGTFMKVGQSLLVRRQLEMEKQLKEKMIHSVMPPKVADWLMEESEREREREDSLKKGSIPSNNTDLRSLFRPFNMHSMEDVSILFADIVGFTKMSSNKTAEELVAILNDLFERFDDLCEHHGCEKISTLGDCYYCVSGCPEPRSDHAKCCVEMGLAMIEAIKQFDIERREGVNMRVGVHTGTVLCGIVGTKRFKFDVWSNDVTLANKLESTGKPGRVHLSEKTLSFLDDEYLTEDGDMIKGVKTFFIKSKKIDLVNEFITNVNTAKSSISPLMISRNRLNSCNNQGKIRPHYLYMMTNTNNYKVKANSLPSILDSENDEDMEEEDEEEDDEEGGGDDDVEENGKNKEIIKKVDINETKEIENTKEKKKKKKKKESNKSPLSTASCENKKLRGKPWRYLKRQKTTETMSPTDIYSIKQENTANVKETNDINKYLEQNGTQQSVYCVEMDPNPVPSSPLLPRDDSLSHTSSICSRKDSGIRSNSRRSSIQQQLYLMNGMTQENLLSQRVSGYYTSNSTLNSNQEPSSSAATINGTGTISTASPTYTYPHPYPPTVADTFGACFHKLRKQSDLQLIRCVQDNVTSQRSYFVKPPLSRITLFFKNNDMEKEYRENAHKASENIGGNPPTLATSRFNTYFDILVSALVYSSITISLFLLCQSNKPTYYFLIFCGIATAIQVFVVALCIRQLVDPNSIYAFYTQKIFKFFTKWYPWHACGAILVALPVISILMNLGCNNTITNHNINNDIDYYYCYLIFVGLVHFCNFTQLNCWMKNFLVTITAILFIILLTTSVINSPLYLSNNNVNNINNNIKLNNESHNDIENNINGIIPIDLNVPFNLKNNTTKMAINSNNNTNTNTNLTNNSDKKAYNESFYKKELFIDIFLLLVLVWLLNREFEISYRLSFHGNAVAARDKSRVQSMKNQADWLLHNIIPKYVADQLKTTAKYSQNHKSVGIIFASIVNFNELYDESYLGGKEYLRVLNELIGDFDELLEKNEFSNVEKIKTIGSTFMAASGLNPQVRNKCKNEYTHIYQLIDFAVAMQKVIFDFNRDLLGFQLILRIGFNYGDVTAGVIGSTKLYYDIWGDAVNIASRMDSTGVAGRIQLASNCIDILSDKYEFEPRGQVYVKGKDNMNVFLLTGKKNI